MSELNLINTIILVWLGPVIAAIGLLLKYVSDYRKTKAEVKKIEASTSLSALPPATSPVDAQDKVMALITNQLEATTVQLKDTYSQLSSYAARADSLSTALDDCRDKLRRLPP